jgi:hypothetical protein
MGVRFSMWLRELFPDPRAQTTLPDLQYKFNELVVPATAKCRTFSVSEDAHPRTDLQQLELWTSFEDDISASISEGLI